jgi:tetratricopeptide (TPR) repeat protein
MMTVARFPWRRVVLIAVIVCAWAPFKLLWEQNIKRQQDQLRYHGVVVTRTLRDQLSQGLTIGILAGFRNVVADFVWLQVTVAWEKYEWFKMDSLISLVTSLEPRAILFWDNGGWQLAWNVSIYVKDDVAHQPSELRRLHDSRFWIFRGMDVYKRGLENNPTSPQLWISLGELYQNRLGDYRDAAYAYSKAAALPDAPSYIERFQAIMLQNGGYDAEALEAWKALWFRLTPAQREEKQHWKEKIISNIQLLEKKLNVPKEKRVFPN